MHIICWRKLLNYTVSNRNVINLSRGTNIDSNIQIPWLAVIRSQGKTIYNNITCRNINYFLSICSTFENCFISPIPMSGIITKLISMKEQTFEYINSNIKLTICVENTRTQLQSITFTNQIINCLSYTRKAFFSSDNNNFKTCLLFAN